jgi:hypothetical protein
VDLPDFMIVGAMKCGTSTLAVQLSAQAGVFMTDPKEPNFFSDDAVFARGHEWYEALFAAAPPGAIRGEASTHYTKLPTHPQTLERMTAMLAAPRIVYLIRNPLQRLVSHYVHEWTMGVMRGSLAESLEDFPELVDYGCYGHQIRPYVEAFGHDRVLVQTLEEMERDPVAVLERTARFIGLEGSVVWQAERARDNVSAERIRRFPLQDLLIDNPVAARLRRALVPRAVREWVRRSRQMPERPQIPKSRLPSLIEVFCEDHHVLRAQFPDRPELAESYPFLARA